jgi:hypothetical protein
LPLDRTTYRVVGVTEWSERMTGKTILEFPVRGTPGGWKDIWDSPDDSGELRTQIADATRRADARAEALRPAPGQWSPKKERE